MTHSPLTNQIRLSSQHSSREGARIDTFLIHHQAGTNDDAVIAAMISGSRKVSANYTIRSDGRLTCVVDEDLRAWTSGSTEDGGKGAAWDRRAITVEIENAGGEPNWPISDAAIEKAALLLLDLEKRYAIANVLGHRDLWEKFRASYATYCPGPDTVAKIVAKATELRGGAAPSAPAPSTPAPESSTVPNVFGLGNVKGLQKIAKLYGYSGEIDNVWGDGSKAGFAQFLSTNWGYSGNDVRGPVMIAAEARWLRAKYGYVGNDVFGPDMRAALGRANDANMAAL